MKLLHSENIVSSVYDTDYWALTFVCFSYLICF